MKRITPFIIVILIITACKKSSTPAIYDSVTVGSQVWMKKNLTTSRYRNGDPIPNVTDNIAWAALTTGAWCWYSNDSTTYAIYGKLYNWYAVNDPRGLAPTGCHIPSDDEFTTLSTFLGGNAAAGGKIKETGTTHWNTPNLGATDSSGLTALPGGYREQGTGIFREATYTSNWWSSTKNASTDAWFRCLFYNNIITLRASFYLQEGFSVRCIKD